MHIATSSVSVLGFFADPRLHVIGSCECGGLSLLLLHHTAFGVHSIYDIKNAGEEVGRCYPNYYDCYNRQVGCGLCIHYTVYSYVPC